LFESNFPGMSKVNITLAKKLALGSVFNETTVTFVDNNENWYAVVNNTQGRYYPRAISTVYYAGIFTDFEMVIPYEEAWERPGCFPDFPVKRAIAPPISPSPLAYSYTIIDPLFVSNIYVDGVNSFFRSDDTFPATMRYPTLVITNLIRPTGYYISVKWMPINPTPCVYANSTMTYQNSNSVDVYYGSVSVGNGTDPKYLDFYSTPGSEVWSAFDHKTQNLEAIYYSGFPENYVTNWNPTTPSPTMFNIPTSCYPIPSMLKDVPPHPLAPMFPKGMTMYIFDGYDEFVIYSDQVNQMWRIDTPFTTTIQTSNTLYTFINVDPESSLIQPLPCYQYLSPYSFIPDLPATFSSYVGNATFNSIPVSIWGALGQFWYWDNTITPQFFMIGGSPSVVTFFQPTPPPSVIFNPPAFCLSGAMSSKPTNFFNRHTSPLDRLYRK